LFYFNNGVYCVVERIDGSKKHVHCKIQKRVFYLRHQWSFNNGVYRVVERITDHRNMISARSFTTFVRSGGHFSATTGFTLIEVIVTLTVLSFILLVIFGAFRLGLSAWERGESTKEEYQKVRIITQLISQQIKSIVPYKIKTQKAEGDYLAFEGKARSLKFVSALPIKAKRPEGFVYATYEFKEGGSEGGRLILYEQRVLNRDFFEEDPKEELGVSLLEGISNVRFEYYQEEDQVKNRKEEWVEEWKAKEEKALPKAFRMTITYPAYRQAITLLASIPSYRFEEVRIGISRGVIPQRPPGAGP
jgi:prepilin-type N-terminal cleavage/methylation domain-containing protein